MSEINKIAAALAKAQAVMPPAKMNSTNPFLKNKYADLGSVIEASRKPLADNELSITQLVTGDETRIVVETILMHASGQSISSRMSLALSEGKGMSSAQAAGSIITYLRRYSLSAILGIYADEDSDGNEPKQEPRKKQAPAPSEQAIRKAAAIIVDMKPETAAALHNAVERKASGDPMLRLEPYKLNKMLDKKAKAYGDKEASQKQRNLFVLLLDQVLQDDSKRHIVCKYLFGEGSSKEISGAYIWAALDWLDGKKDDGGAYSPSEDAEREINAVYNAAIAENQPALV